MKRKNSSPRLRKKPSSQAQPQPAVASARYIFFGGKGGVGKTTASCATALALLDRANQGEHILLFSTDPSHSLSDSIGIEIGDRLVEVARRGRARLFAREMDAAAALAKFISRHEPMLKLIAEHGTLLDESDINELLNLSLPGLDEMMAMFELSESEREGRYARIVIDTAPSGHTWRLLQLPQVLSRWVGALDRMEDKHRYMLSQFVRGARQPRSEADLFLSDLSERIDRVRGMLYAGDRAAFALVTVAEGMVVEETSRYFAMLRKHAVPVSDLIINRVEREREGCGYCRARAAAQAPWLSRIHREFKALRIHAVPLLNGEVQGRARLRRFARLLWDGEASEAPYKPRRSRAARVDLSCGEARFDIRPRRMLIFGGKGGVGKTTAAAAAAIAIAESRAGARVLVFSSDPAHSLADSFASPVGAQARRVAGFENLDAIEIDPIARFEQFKQRYQDWIDEAFNALTAGSRWEIQFDREAMREVVALAPPGIDEIVALGAISDLLDENSYTTIVLDTAPTGHLLRFLELPEVALSWVRAIMKLLLKYKDVVNWSSIAEEMIALSKSIKRVAALLTDAQECEFISVAIAEKMSLEETVRLTESLERLKVPNGRMLINMIVPAEAAYICDFCKARRRRQIGIIHDFEMSFKDRVELFAAPQQPFEVRGADRLRRHFACWQPISEQKAALL